MWQKLEGTIERMYLIIFYSTILLSMYSIQYVLLVEDEK